jgi:hypothetical protein
MNGRPVPEDVLNSVMAFFMLFTLSVGITSVLLSMTGLDLVTSVSGAATALANIGPGLGPIIGPAGNFAPLNDTAKWIMTVAMLLGRLELMVVLVLFTPASGGRREDQFQQLTSTVMSAASAVRSSGATGVASEAAAVTPFSDRKVASAAASAAKLTSRGSRRAGPWAGQKHAEDRPGRVEDRSRRCRRPRHEREALDVFLAAQAAQLRQRPKVSVGRRSASP